MTSRSVLDCITTPRAQWQRPGSTFNNNRSPSLCRTWNYAPPLSGLLNYHRSVTFGHFHKISHTKSSSMAMGSGRLSPSVDLDAGKASNESSPLLHNDQNPRPCQAYCVTEASSRPPSPNTLTPRPLRIRRSLSPIRDDESRCLPSIPPTPSTTALIEQDHRDVENVPALGVGGDEEEEHTNGSPQYRSTMLLDANHITQAVTPRGSPPLMDNQPIMYDRTPSQVRMQRSTPEYVATTSTCRRKPLPQHAVDTSMAHRPLPPLPPETAPVKASYDVRRGSHNADSEEVDEGEAWRPSLAYFGIEKLGDGPRSQSQVVPQMSLETDAVHGPGSEPSRSSDEGPTTHRIMDKRTSYHSWKPRGRTTRSPARTDLGGHIQMASSGDLYEPRGLLSEMDDDRRAFRRTQPKDAKFKYQFGRRPSTGLERPPLPPPQQSLPNLSVIHYSPTVTNPPQTYEALRRPSPSPSLRSYAETQAGPRPPPWGSSDNLELRRQTRSEAREREEARRFRMTIDGGSSIYKGSDSMDSLRQNTMRREVEEYREQVLQIYPDMEFDGNAGKGGRTCYCVVM